MGGDAAFGDVMHLLGPDLDFHPLLFRTHHRGVDGAIAIGLGVEMKSLNRSGTICQSVWMTPSAR